MNIPRISIQQTPGRIAIESRQAKLNLTSRQVRMNMRQLPAVLEIERTNPRIEIDQTEAFASSGLKTPLTMARDFYNGALSAGLSAIGSIAEEGLQFLRIEDKGNPIYQAAVQRMDSKMRQFGAVAMPGVRPKIHLVPGELDIRWTPRGVEADWEFIDGKADFIPHEVNIWMDPYPSIEITVEMGSEMKYPMPKSTVDESI